MFFFVICSIILSSGVNNVIAMLGFVVLRFSLFCVSAEVGPHVEHFLYGLLIHIILIS